MIPIFPLKSFKTCQFMNNVPEDGQEAVTAAAGSLQLVESPQYLAAEMCL